MVFSHSHTLEEDWDIHPSGNGNAVGNRYVMIWACSNFSVEIGSKLNSITGKFKTVDRAIIPKNNLGIVNIAKDTWHRFKVIDEKDRGIGSEGILALAHSVHPEEDTQRLNMSDTGFLSPKKFNAISKETITLKMHLKSKL